MLLFWGTLGFGKGQPLFPYLRLLLRYIRQICYEDTPEETISGVLSRFRESSEELKFSQQYCCPSYYEMPQDTRIAVACKAACVVWDAYHMPELIQTMLGPHILTAQDLQLEGSWPCQAALQGSHPWKRQVRHESRLLGPSLHIKMRKGIFISMNRGENFFKAGVDLNHIVDRQTLLLAFLEGYLDWFDVSKCQILYLSGALQNWLTDLKSAGIDLQKFGEKEDSIWKRELVRRDFGAGDEENPSWFYYGSSITDWPVFLSPKGDVFIGDFWHLVEQPAEMMAGGWPYE
ncbi:hypothetical protein N7486_009345 [Penicillium sp. IBT 16267x]|nr:hypothetical protein N7486_009345 [Penicillium sp. IBT 16267x]